METQEFVCRAIPVDPEVRERLLIETLKRRQPRKHLPKYETESFDELLGSRDEGDPDSIAKEPDELVAELISEFEQFDAEWKKAGFGRHR